MTTRPDRTVGPNAGGKSLLCNSYQDNTVHCLHCDALLTWDGTGRPPLYCSNAHRQADYRGRRDARLAIERQEARQAHERHLVEQEARRQARYLERLENVIMGELASLPDNSRISTTQRRALAHRLTMRLGTEQLALT